MKTNKRFFVQTVSKGELKAKMYEYLRQVEQSGKHLTITDRGIPVLTIQPIQDKKKVDDVFGVFRDQYKEKEGAFGSENEEWGDLS